MNSRDPSSGEKNQQQRGSVNNIMDSEKMFGQQSNGMKTELWIKTWNKYKRKEQ